MAETVKPHKNTKIEENQISNEKKKNKMPLIITSGVLLFIVGIGIIIHFNIGNLTEKYLRTPLEKIPIINNLLLTKNQREDRYLNLSKEDLISQIEELENTLEKKEQLIDIKENTIEDLESEIKRLKEIEDNQIQYRSDKQKFDEMIASQNPAEFMEFYKEMYPDTAAQVYEKLIGEEKQLQDVKKYSEPFQTMDPANAAKVFEEMIGTDIDLVVLILNNIDSEQQAAILGEMNPTEAAKVIKTMAPQ